MDRVTLDFEENTITWESDRQTGTEHCADLRERKAEILAAMGYEQWDASAAISALNAFINGEISEQQMEEIFDREVT